MVACGLGEPRPYGARKSGALVQDGVPAPGRETFHGKAGSVPLCFHAENGFHPRPTSRSSCARAPTTTTSPVRASPATRARAPEGHHPPDRAGQTLTCWSIRKLADHLRKTSPGPSESAGGSAVLTGPLRDPLPAHEDLRRSHLTRTWTPSPPASSARSTSGPTARSPSTSSAHWASASASTAAPAGQNKAGQTGCRRPTAAPTASPTSTAAIPSATAKCGESIGGARASTTPGRAAVDPRRPPGRRPDLRDPRQPVRPPEPANPWAGDPEQGRAVPHPDLRVLPTPSKPAPDPAAVRAGQLSHHPNHTVQTRGSARLPAPAQPERPPPRRPRSPMTRTSPHPQ